MNPYYPFSAIERLFDKFVGCVGWHPSEVRLHFLKWKYSKLQHFFLNIFHPSRLFIIGAYDAKKVVLLGHWNEID